MSSCAPSASTSEPRGRTLTDRLDLRPMTVADAPQLARFLTDPQMWWWHPPGVHADVAETIRYAERAAARWVSDGLSYWTARLRGTDEVVGSGGVQLHGDRLWNLNYRIARPHQGAGLATELARAALAAAAAHEPALPCVAWIDPVNTPSRRVAAGVGLVDRGVREGSAVGRPQHAYADRALDDTAYPPTQCPSA